MSNPFTSFESRLKIYRRVWIGAVVITLILRFTVFLHTPEHHRIFIWLAFALGTWLPLIIASLYEQTRIKSYIQAHHPSRWDALGVRMLIWRFSRSDFDDPQVTVLRSEALRLEHYMVIAFISLIPMLLIIMV